MRLAWKVLFSIRPSNRKRVSRIHSTSSEPNPPRRSSIRTEAVAYRVSRSGPKPPGGKDISVDERTAGKVTIVPITISKRNSSQGNPSGCFACPLQFPLGNESIVPPFPFRSGLCTPACAWHSWVFACSWRRNRWRRRIFAAASAAWSWILREPLCLRPT
jgi:hypothetical protein